jgi:hypothetical protein
MSNLTNSEEMLEMKKHYTPSFEDQRGSFDLQYKRATTIKQRTTMKEIKLKEIDEDQELEKEPTIFDI